MPMTTLERLAAVLAVSAFYVGSLSIACQVYAAYESDLALSAFEEADYQRYLAARYREVILDNLEGTEASLGICQVTRAALQAELEARRSLPIETEVDR